MINLIEEIDAQLERYGLAPISDVVNNKENSAKYIDNILKQYGHKVVIPFHTTKAEYDFRVKHVLFSFGLGVVLASFQGLIEKIEQLFSKYGSEATFFYAWLTTCLYHDYGYFIGSEFVHTDSLDRIPVDYSIFDFPFCSSRYTKALYVKYYQEKHKKQEKAISGDKGEPEEVGDHGILGGYYLFDKLCTSETNGTSPINTSLIDSSSKIPAYQDICFRIMEHNIWKKDKSFKESDPFYSIGKDQFVKVGLNESLLYLLSLVDTVEMTKKFCKYKDDSDDKERFIFPKTLGKQVKINVTDNQIEIDYKALKQYITKHKHLDSDGFDDWEHGVVGLKDWVEISTPVPSDGTILLTK